jgi:hypothetical protein
LIRARVQMTSVLIDPWSVRMLAARRCEPSRNRRFEARYRSLDGAVYFRQLSSSIAGKRLRLTANLTVNASDAEGFSKGNNGVEAPLMIEWE